MGGNLEGRGTAEFKDGHTYQVSPCSLRLPGRNPVNEQYTLGYEQERISRSSTFLDILVNGQEISLSMNSTFLDIIVNERFLDTLVNELRIFTNELSSEQYFLVVDPSNT